MTTATFESTYHLVNDHKKFQAGAKQMVRKVKNDREAASNILVEAGLRKSGKASANP